MEKRNHNQISVNKDNYLEENYSLKNLLVGKPNKSKTCDATLTPIVFTHVRTKLGVHPKIRTLKCLLDSGSSASLMNMYYAKKLRLKADTTTKWSTTAEHFATNYTTKVEFSMPEMHERRIIKHKFHVTPNEMGYDMIIGRDLLQELGIDSISWDEAEIPMRPQNTSLQDSYYIND